MAVTGISITADSRNIEKPAVTLVIEFPAWHDAKRGQHPFDSSPVQKKGKETEKRA